MQRELVALAPALPGVENGSGIPSFRPGSEWGVGVKRKITMEEYAYGFHNLSAAFDRGSTCRLCCKLFGSRNSLFQHLERDHGDTSRARRLQEAAETFLEGERKKELQLEELQSDKMLLHLYEQPDLVGSDSETDDDNDTLDNSHLLDHNIADLGDSNQLQDEPIECRTREILLNDLNTASESEPDEPKPAELPPTGNIYHLHDGEPTSHSAGSGGQPPPEKHSVATVNTTWKTGTSRIQTIRALCDSGCNTTAIRKWLAMAILAVTNGTLKRTEQEIGSCRRQGTLSPRWGVLPFAAG